MEMELIAKGGVMLWLLMGLSVYVAAVVMFKIWQFQSARVLSTYFIDGTLHDIRSGDYARAMQRLGTLKSPVARVMRICIECLQNPHIPARVREAEVMRVGSADLRALESHLRGLEMTATVAPLLGLLGTVMGLINSFSKLGVGGTRVDPTLLAGGIWEALLATAGGLAVAIPALAAHYILDALIEKVRGTMKDVTVQILAQESIQRVNPPAPAPVQELPPELYPQQSYPQEEVAAELQHMDQLAEMEPEDAMHLLKPRQPRVRTTA